MQSYSCIDKVTSPLGCYTSRVLALVFGGGIFSFDHSIGLLLSGGKDIFVLVCILPHLFALQPGTRDLH